MNKSSKRIAYIIKTKFVCEEYLNVLPRTFIAINHRPLQKLVAERFYMMKDRV